MMNSSMSQIPDVLIDISLTKINAVNPEQLSIK